MPRPRKEPTESIRIRTETKNTVKTVAEHFGVPVVDAIGLIIDRFATLSEADKAEWLGTAEEKLEPKVVNGMVLGSYLQKKLSE
tara:strand:- start:28 stop:279 length:252 start_codon:yes stop_codon:yes gene_type:complete